MQYALGKLNAATTATTTAIPVNPY